MPSTPSPPSPYLSAASVSAELPPLRARYLRLRGFSSDDNLGYNRSLAVHVEPHLWDLDVAKIPNIPIPEEETDGGGGWKVFGASESNILRLRKDQIYDADFVYLPTHLTQSRKFNMDKFAFDELQLESKKQGIIWVGRIQGISAITELLENYRTSQNLETIVMHPILDDLEKTIEVNSARYGTIKPDHTQNIREWFFTPLVYGESVFEGANCRRARCPICRAEEKYRLYAQRLKELEQQQHHQQ